ncbi:PRTRC system protein F [Noviherbaspirillum pedocola]|uniref:PRTRC system protein F n=1 Tax=Noviherbaspirillum pedocola TaxID=2801341 RepID=A0A934SWK7_9BURK|nr:PRTRC system protein F [Noviherbaspirillum pedocola]MBK4737910.1 PRTRC system protein F [Noviherbaspirillum pedocola]
MFKGYESSYVPQQGSGIAATTAVPAPFLLNLPRLAPTVPQFFTQATHPSIVQLARQLNAIGVIHDSDLQPEETIEGVIKKAIGRGIEEVLGKLSMIELSVDINDGEIDEYSELSEECGDKPAAGRFHFTVDVGAIPTAYIGERILALEAMRPGLGETVYAVLQWAGYGSMLLFTFQHVFENLPFLYHFDEREDEETEEGEGDDDADSDADSEFEGMPTKKQLLEGLPQWVGSPELKLTPAQLKRMIGQASTPDWAKEILRSTLAIADLWEEGAYKLGEFTYRDQEPVYTLAVVRFNEQDTMGRILDDYFYMANASSDSYTQSSHFELVGHDDIECFRRWWKGILNGFRLVRHIDTLLHQLCNGTFRHGG